MPQNYMFLYTLKFMLSLKVILTMETKIVDNYSTVKDYQEGWEYVTKGAWKGIHGHKIV